jgi:hypothetical protein
MYLTWGPSTWAPASGYPLYSVSFSSIHQQRSLSAISQWRMKNTDSHSLVFTRDSRNKKNWEQSSGQAHLINIWTMEAIDRTSDQPQVKLTLLRRYFYPIWPMDSSYTKNDLRMGGGLQTGKRLLRNPPTGHSYTVIRFVRVSAKFGTCTVVSVNGTLVEGKMR